MVLKGKRKRNLPSQQRNKRHKIQNQKSLASEGLLHVKSLNSECLLSMHAFLHLSRQMTFLADIILYCFRTHILCFGTAIRRVLYSSLLRIGRHCFLSVYSLFKMHTVSSISDLLPQTQENVNQQDQIIRMVTLLQSCPLLI